MAHERKGGAGEVRRNVVQAVPDLKEPAFPISLGNLLHQYQLENVVNTFAVSGKK